MDVCWIKKQNKTMLKKMIERQNKWEKAKSNLEYPKSERDRRGICNSGPKVQKSKKQLQVEEKTIQESQNRQQWYGTWSQSKKT